MVDISFPDVHDYCDECICYETEGFTTTTLTTTVTITVTTTENTATTTKSQCFNPNNVGDGFCDDETNIASCLFEGGDCCGPDVVKVFCDECACLEEQGKSNSK